ncbi:hypothetical protein Lser_V15G21659 [Lactuca serriola]
MDKSWMGAYRTSETYVKGVAEFIKYAVRNYKISKHMDPADTKKKIRILCPCVKCVNHICHSVDVVDDHLFRNGIDQTYTNWNKHGETEEPPRSYVYEHNFDMDTSNVVDSTNMNIEMPTDAAETLEMVEDVEENFIGNPDKFREPIEDAEKPLYTGCLNFTKLSAIIQLLNLKKGNEMYSSTYEAKKAFKAMGSGYTKIHACVNNCILYRKEYTDLVACPTCGKSRWKVDEQKNKIYNNIPAKCLWYFPIIPRFKRLFQSKTTTKYLAWHTTERMVDVGALSHPADSPAWAAIDDKYPDFASEPRNLRLGISADGVDVNRGNRSHSVWHVLTVIYNLPPWLCMKRKFIMLSLLILGTPRNDIDVFLAPFVDDLQLLFDFGVETYDVYAQEHFKLHVVVLWTINDYPALGTLSGCPYNGFQGCVVCGEETHCIRLLE